MDLQIRVVPKAKRNSIEIGDDGLFKVRVIAAPERGKANDAVIALLSKLIGVPKRDIQIVRGHTVRNKLVRVEGATTKQVIEKLSSD
jgi:uncharacterized protein (TIGR00251 family)